MHSRLIAAPAIVALIIAFYFRFASVNNTTVALTLLLAILGISTGWGLLEATIASLAAVLGFNYLFSSASGHARRCRIRRIGWHSVAFLVTAVTASQLSARAKRRTREAVERRREIEGLYALSQSLLLSGSARTASQDLVSRVVQILGVSTAAFHAKADAMKRSAGDRRIPADLRRAVAARSRRSV